jgi:AcrR family transcriptional regulator
METKKERRMENTRQRILAAAREIVIQNGMDGLSMRALAEKVDYSPAAVYKYFQNKEAILKAIQDEGWALAAQVHAQAMEGARTTPERLLAAARGYLQFAARYPEHYLLMFNSPHLAPETVAEIGEDPNFGGLISILDEGVASGDFQLPEGFNPKLMAFLFWTSAHGMAMIRINYLRHAADEFDELCDRMIRTFMDAISVHPHAISNGKQRPGNLGHEEKER